jgi:membrane protein DedA with SNARE-associated domain
VAGAIVGDGFSFWLGHRFHRQILRGWPLNRFARMIERSSQFVAKFGAASVFLARFMAIVRAFVPLAAGIVRMSSRQFYLANILSALVWAPIHVFPGVLVGLAMALGGVQLTLAAVGILILAWIAWSIIKRKAVAIVYSSAGRHPTGSSRDKSGPPPRDHRPGRAA